MIPSTSSRPRFAVRQPGQPLGVAHGLLRHRKREVQAPIELDLAALGHRALHRGDEFAQIIELSVANPANRRYRLDFGANHEASRRVLGVGTKTPPQARFDQGIDNINDSCNPAVSFFCRTQFA
ncbi:hypothetical protein LMTR3_35815 [Bradyrhizobium sp. LMTR 3]|nr:hypothetical protein LMTR3_35815 [Bradyrhizobium sp. LMTR 3]